MKDKLRKGIPQNISSINRALIDSFGGEIGAHVRLDDKIEVDKIRATATHSVPWSGNVYSYRFGDSNSDKAMP